MFGKYKKRERKKFLCVRNLWKRGFCAFFCEGAKDTAPLSCGIGNGRPRKKWGQTGRKKGEQIGRKKRGEREGEREGRGMRLAFDTACQRPEGWSGSRQPDRRIILGIRSKTLLETLLQTENTRQKGFAAPCVERDTSQDAVYQKRFHLLSSFYL